MDRAELKSKLINFQKACEENKKPITDLCVEDAYPGDNSTSFILQVKASWVDNMACSTALDFLFEMLWKTSDEKTRESIFMIQVLDSKDELHCAREAENQKKRITQYFFVRSF